jgi:hypothetical protein
MRDGLLGEVLACRRGACMLEDVLVWLEEVLGWPEEALGWLD